MIVGTDEDDGGRRGRETTVIFDANALMMPAQFGVDVFDEVERLVGGYEAVVPRAVVEELRSLAGRDRDAELALDLVERCRVVEGSVSGNADDVIVDLAEDAVVVTNDANLKSRLLENNVPVAHMRQKSYLEVAYP